MKTEGIMVVAIEIMDTKAIAEKAQIMVVAILVAAALVAALR
jgi:hypothetical protein